MFLELIAIFAAGFGAAGAVLLLNRLTGGRVPGWVMPVAAGLTMLGFGIWSEYTWAARTAEALPEGVEVVDSTETRALWKPWTYLMPQTTRLVALDRSTIRDNPDAPQVRLVELYLFQRWRATESLPVLVDCARSARALVTDAALEEPAKADWTQIPKDDPLIRAVCPEQ
jgi:hypothetical protein